MHRVRIWLIVVFLMGLCIGALLHPIIYLLLHLPSLCEPSQSRPQQQVVYHRQCCPETAATKTTKATGRSINHQLGGAANWGHPDNRFTVKTADALSTEPTPVVDSNTKYILYDEQNIHKYPPTNNSHNSNNKSSVWLVVYVPTAAGFGPNQLMNPMVAKSVKNKGQPAERREVIRANFRRSWLYRNGQAVLWFVIGTQSPTYTDPAIRAQLDAEKHAYGDLLIVDCPDVDVDFHPPSGTTIKMGYAFQHALVNYNYNYFARGSDDVHFNVDQLYRLIAIHKVVPQKRLFMGKRWNNMGVQTDDHHARFGKHYPAYAQGLGYILSADVAQPLGHLVQMGVPLSSDWPEDAIVGSWVAGWGLNLVDSLRWFHNKIGPRGLEWPFPCTDDAVMIHELSPAELRRVEPDGVWRCDDDQTSSNKFVSSIWAHLVHWLDW
eukprot:PhM_4_TR2064/c0_g1_i1/m.99817